MGALGAAAGAWDGPGDSGPVGAEHAAAASRASRAAAEIRERDIVVAFAAIMGVDALRVAGGIALPQVPGPRARARGELGHRLELDVRHAVGSRPRRPNMTGSRSLAILLPILALGALAVWFLDPFGSVEPPPQAVSQLAKAPADPANAAAAAPSSAAPGAAELVDRTAAGGAGKAGALVGVGFVGRVVDDLGRPVEGAHVRCGQGFGPGMDMPQFDMSDFEDFDPQVLTERFRALQKERSEVVTDADGRFRLVPASAARVLGVRVLARGFTVLDRNLPRPADGDRDLGELKVTRGAVVAGRVVDGAGNPVAAARVQRVDAKQDEFGFGAMFGDVEMPGADLMDEFLVGQVAVTGADGRFELAHCEPGDFALRAKHPDHPSARREGLTVAPGAALADVLVVVEPGASIRGRVVGVPAGTRPLRVMASQKRDQPAAQPGGAPDVMGMVAGFAGDLAGDAGLGFGEKQVETGADFEFELRGLQVGKTYRVWSVQNGRGIAGVAVCSSRAEVTSGAGGVELRYEAGISVTFQVVDEKSGAPLDRLWIDDQLRGGGGNGFGDFMNFVPRGGRARTYPDGRVTIANLRPKKDQTLRVKIDALGHESCEKKDIALPATGSLDLGVLALAPAPIVHVVVTTGPDKTPVAGATVRLSEAERGRGRGNRGGPGGGNGDPAAMFGDFAQGMAGPGGGPFAGMFGGGPRTGKTDAAGCCDVNAFAAAMVVEITAKDFAPYRSEPFTLPEGKGGEHRALLLRGGEVAVTVLDADGKPLASARVEHRAPVGGRDDRQTDEKGVARFEHLAPGDHRFRLAQRGGGGGQFPGGAIQARVRGLNGQPPAADAGWQTVSVADGATAALQLDKKATAVLHGIVRENGAPLAGARVAFVEGADGGDDPQGQRIEDAMAGFLPPGAGGGAGGRSTQSGDDGAYRLAELPPGVHRLRVTSRERVMPAVVAVTLRAGDNAFDVELDAAMLRGTVRDSAGNPVEGATVALVQVRNDAAAPAGGDERVRRVQDAMEGMDLGQFGMGGRGQVKTGADGTYQLRGVQAGKPLQVRATAKGFSAAVSAVVDVSTAGVRDGVDVVLGAAGRVKVEIANGPMFAQIRAVRVEEDGSRIQGVAPVATMMRNGKATLDGLAPGRWKVTTTGMDGQESAPHYVVVVAGETASLQY